MSAQLTNVELAFETLKDQLQLLNEGNTWQVEVRFAETNSETFAQILSLLISDKFFRFQTSPIMDVKHSILFTDRIEKNDLKTFRIVMLRGQSPKSNHKIESSKLIKVSGIDGEQEYSIFTIKNPQLSSEKLSNAPSQLTRPDIFPTHTRQNIPVPLWKISFSSEAQYSASPMKASEMMVTDIIQSLNEQGFDGKNISFLDGTANCGADSINSVFISANLHRPFQVFAIELNELNHRALKENITLFGCDPNITAIHADTVKWLSDYSENKIFDCMYFDPPWGGKNYKAMEKVTLELGGINIWSLCKEIMDRSVRQNGKLRLITIKGPPNWNMNDAVLATIKPLVKFKPFRNIIYAYINVDKYRKE